MQKLLIISIVTVLSTKAVKISLHKGQSAHDRHVRDEFVRFQGKKGRSYKTHEEFEKRYHAFEQHLDEIEQANSERKNENSAFYKVNDYTDWTDEELHELLGLGEQPEEEEI